MEAVVPWARLVAVLEPHDPAGRRRRPPVGLERMPLGHELGAEWLFALANLYLVRRQLSAAAAA